ncbi:hypothetical protein M8494_35820 [Serratia ureilytica]
MAESKWIPDESFDHDAGRLLGRPTVRSPRRHGRPPVCGIRRRRAGSRPTRQAVDALYLHHPLLRLRITDDGRQTIAPPAPAHLAYRRLATCR